MSQAIYIGGFSGGRKSAERVQEALGTYYEDVEAYTFAEAMNRLAEVKKASKKKPVITHSAGLLALEGASPSEVVAFGAPLPRGRIALLGASARKQAQMHIDARSMPNLVRAIRFDIESGIELAVPTRDRGRTHWKHFLNGSISRFDAIEAGRELQHEGCEVSLTYGTRDLFFNPSVEQEREAVSAGVDITRAWDDVHDALVLNPAIVLHNHFTSLR